MNNSDKKIERITVLAKDFTPAAMEFHKKNMSARHNLSKKNRCFKPCESCNVRGDVIGKDIFDIWENNNE